MQECFYFGHLGIIPQSPNKLGEVRNSLDRDRTKNMVVGRRVEIIEDSIELKPGDYSLYKGHWWVYPPLEGAGPVPITGYGTEWQVTEHEDKTITVSPSIFVHSNPPWHGFLTKGEWISC